MSTRSDGFSSSRPSLCTAQHSVLQQERLYLLRALADEEQRKERLTSTLNKIEMALATTDESRQANVLQKNLRNVRSKLNRCERTGQALCINLEAVMAQMQRLDDHQWRRAHHDYAQQTQHGLMTSLSLTNSAWPAIAPSAAPGMQPFYTTPLPQSPFGYYQPTHALYNPVEQTLTPQVPPTPILRPLQYTNSDTFQLRSCQGIPTTIGSDAEYHDGISLTDTVSTYSLNPWVGVAPPQNTLSTAYVPPTQVFDLVQGLGTMAISGSENQTPGVWARSAHSAPVGSTASHQWQMQGAYNASSKSQNCAGKRRSV